MNFYEIFDIFYHFFRYINQNLCYDKSYYRYKTSFILVLLLLITSITSISYTETDPNGTVSIYLDKNKIIDICIMISTPGGGQYGWSVDQYVNIIY